jgi:endonuclease/exonuclease/phosphatase family metal-dependent hydrolase
MKVKVLSWNIWCDGDFEGVKRFLSDADADVIALQEILPNDAERDVIGFLNARGYAHAYARALDMSTKHGVFEMGNAIFSRHPIVTSETLVLSEEQRRVAVQADIEAGGMILHAFSVHLVHAHRGSVSQIQEAQARTLFSVVPREHSVVMGDFNAPPSSAAVSLMREALKDTDPLSLPTWSTNPEGCAACKPHGVDTRFDYIFTTPDIKTSGFAAHQDTSSDHLPISITLEL